MTCAKRRVICILSDDFGRVAVGENSCALPQPTCPRLPGEGYEKCKTVCEQYAHAEIDALDAWESRYSVILPPTHALIRGHDYVCAKCEAYLRSAGVKHVTFGEPHIGRAV